MSPQLCASILAYLGVDATHPSLDGVDRLLHAYVRAIPWESVSRIARKARGTQPYLMPEAFWQSAMTNGTGGTCYESNYALWALLRQLGYQAHLTVNNMQHKIGCHSAIILTLADGRYLVDVGMPFHCAIPIHPDRKTDRTGQFHTYSITPQADATYLIQRDHHPNPYCYTLIDVPIDEHAYQHILIHDYGDNGLFLDRAIITKVIAGHIWRFDSQALPWQMEQFSPHSTDKGFRFLGDDPTTVAHTLSQHFGIASNFVREALHRLDVADMD